MTVTFDSILLADGEARTMRVASGIAPSGEVQMELLEYLRAAWATPVARGNRVVTLPMIISFPAAANFGTALVHALMYFANLPEEGTLVIAEGADQVTFASAVCRNVKQVESIEGLSHEVALQFICGEPVNATLSPLAQMDARYPNILDLAGLTGGGSTKLDGQTTTDVAVLRVVKFYLTESGILVPHEWRLLTWTDEIEDADAGIVIPDDFHATTNPKYWHRTL